MHKLRLRGKSVSAKEKEREREPPISKSRIRHHVPSMEQQQQQQPVLRLRSDEEDSFRTSLILPHLTRRFTLLRAKDGSLISLDQMQAHLRTQRETGRLTEHEERAVMHQYRLQSMYEASGDADASGDIAPPRALSTVGEAAEESESIYERKSPAIASFREGSTSFDDPGLSPYTPNASQANAQNGFLSASGPASGSSTPSGSGTGFAMSSTADFYAARDAVLRGNGLFSGGGLERDVLSKMAKSGSSQGSSSPNPLTSSSRSEPSTPLTRKPVHSRAATSGYGRNGSDGEGLSPKSVSSSRVPVPAVFKPEEDEYDPYRPQDSDLGHGWNGAGSYNYENPDPPMTRKQLNRISRALLDIEAELTKTHTRIADPVAEEEDEAFDTTFGQNVASSDDDDDVEQPDENDHSNNSGYSRNGYPYGYEDAAYMSSTSSSDHHQGRAFAYDDTEEIDPPLSRLPSRQDVYPNSDKSPRIEYPDSAQEEDWRQDSMQPPVTPTETSLEHANSRNTLKPNALVRTPSPASPGLAYLQATPPVPQAAGPSSGPNEHLPNSTSERSIASNSTAPPPLSAVQPSFFTHMRQNSQANSLNAGNVRTPPSHSRAKSTASSLNGPPLSPPPSCGLPPLPTSASNGSIGSLMMLGSSAAPPLQRGESSDSASQLHREVEDDCQVGQPIAAAPQHQRAPSFSQFAFPPASATGRSEVYSNHAPVGDGRTSPNGSVDAPVSKHERPDSALSTGSSWRGVGDTASSEYDLSRLSLSSSLPSSPSKAAAMKAMQGISEAQDEDNLSHDQAEEDAIKSFWEGEGKGLNMHDLRDIQERLLQTAFLRGQAQPADQFPSREADDQLDGRTAETEAEPHLGLLGSPFLAQDATIPSLPKTDKVPAVINGKEPISPPHRVPSLNALRGRSSPAHPQSRPSSPYTDRRPSHLRKDSITSLRSRSGASSPAHHAGLYSPPAVYAQADREPFDLREIEREREEAAALDRSPSQTKLSGTRSGSQTPAEPASLSPAHQLRPKPLLRTSNATPSMLIRHVQQQADSATAALKQSSSSLPTSPEYGSSFSPNQSNGNVKRSLSHRKSAKNLRIGAPQLVSASANLEAIPSIDTMRSVVRSPPDGSLKKQPSRLKMRLGASKKVLDEPCEAERLPAPMPETRITAVHASASSNGSSDARGPTDSHSGIRNLMSKLKRRKPSEANLLSPRLMPETLILNSPARVSDDKFSPFFASTASLGHQSRRDIASTGSTGTDPMVDVSPLVISPKTSPNTARQLQPQVQPLSGSVREIDRNSAASQDSMRKLLEAATALGLDSVRVNELIDAAGYKQDPAEKPVRLSVVLPPSVEAPKTPPAKSFALTHSNSAGTSSSGSAKRSQSQRSRKGSVSTVGDTSVSSPNPGSTKASIRTRHRRGSSEAPSVRRSVHDRPPTPPPAAKSLHRRRKSDAHGEENSLPISPQVAQIWATPPKVSVASPQPLRPPPHGQSSLLALADEDERELEMPVPSFMRNAQARSSVVSARSFGSYDAKSIYGLYGDDYGDEEIPPTPGLETIDVLLASGRIPAANGGLAAPADLPQKRASLSLAPGVTPQRLSKMSRNSRIEMAEFANGDIAFNIIQSLRHDSSDPASSAARGTFYLPNGSHSRNVSDASVVDEVLSPVTPLASPGRTIDADPLRLLVKRHQKANKEKVEALEAEAALRTPMQRPRNVSDSANSLNSSQRSVLEVYEAADEAQVAALIEELTRGLDEGQFNLSRSGTISNSSPIAKKVISPQQQPQPQSEASSLKRTPSKVKRQPAPPL